MAKGKRSGHRAEDIIASHAMKHHDFVGGADAERKAAEKQKEARVQHEHAKLETEVVREMARELEAEAGLAAASPPAASSSAPSAAAAPAKGRDHEGASPRAEANAPAAGQGFLARGFELLEEARDNAPKVFETLRIKAEERLAALPSPVKRAIHRGEQAAALLLAPARIGLALARELVKAPAHLVEALRRRVA